MSFTSKTECHVNSQKRLVDSLCRRLANSSYIPAPACNNSAFAQKRKLMIHTQVVLFISFFHILCTTWKVHLYSSEPPMFHLRNSSVPYSWSCVPMCMSNHPNLLRSASVPLWTIYVPFKKYKSTSFILLCTPSKLRVYPSEPFEKCKCTLLTHLRTPSKVQVNLICPP